MTKLKTKRKYRKKSVHHRLRIALAEAGLSQTDLANKLGRPNTSLSDWLLGRHPAPEGLMADIEKALRLKPGSLGGS